MNKIKLIIKVTFKILFKLLEGSILLLIAIFKALPEPTREDDKPYDSIEEARRLRDSGQVNHKRLEKTSFFY